MKKILLSISLLATSITVAQNNETPKPSIEKGTWVVNTNINYYNRESDIEIDTEYSNKTKSTHFSFTPNIGYLITNNLEVGIGTGIGFSESESESTRDDVSGDTKSNNYYIRVSTYIKGYKPINDKLFLFLKGELSYSNQNQNYSYYNSDIESYNNNDSKSNNYFIGIRPGVTYFMSKRIAMEFSLGNLGYTKYIHESENAKTTNNSFSINLFDSAYRFGIAYYF